VTLFRSGPFTVTMTCTRSGSDTALSVDATSTEPGADIDGWRDVSANASYNINNLGPGPASASDNPIPLTMEAPRGAQVVVTGADGMNEAIAPDACWANFAGIA
jgi:hypothetical protein